MWNKLLKKQAPEADPGVLAGPSLSPSKSRSLRLSSPLKLSQKVKASFNIHGNSSQLILGSQKLPEASRTLPRRASQELLSSVGTAPRPKAARRASFNLLARRPSIDALRPAAPQPASPRRELSDATYTRERAATVSGSARSILREPNTPGAGKSVRFFRDDGDLASTEKRPKSPISLSTPPEDVFFDHLERPSPANTFSGMPRLRSSPRSNRPNVAEIFAPLASTGDSQSQDPQLDSFFKELDVPPITPLSPWLPAPSKRLQDTQPSTQGKARDVRPDTRVTPVVDTTNLKGKSHDRSASFSFGQSVFHSADPTASNRSSSSKSSISISDMDSSIVSASSSSSISRNRSFSDTAFKIAMSGFASPKARGNDVKDGAGAEPDPFSANAKTYYTPQTMIPTTPPNGASRHGRRASKEESIIFSLQAQLDMQNELSVQYEADLQARDELVDMLRQKLVEAEEEDAKKRKLLKAWKKKVLELEKTCRVLEDEVEGSRQENMERSIMDEASSEALRMLHRQISGLERERDVWKKTENVLRDELRRLEKLAGERRNEAAMLRASLGSLSEKGEKQKEELITVETLKKRVATLEQQLDVEKKRHEAAEEDWQAEKANLQRASVELGGEVDHIKWELQARDEELAAFKVETATLLDRAEKMAKSAEAGTCALAMERDSMKLQLVKLQEKVSSTELARQDAERRAYELEDDWQDAKKSQEQESAELKEQLREERDLFEAVNQKLKASANRVVELGQERQQAFETISRLEDAIRRRDREAANDAQRNFRQANDIEELREQMSRMRQEHSVAAEDQTSKQTETDAQARALLDSKAENERLRDQVCKLQQESANKDVRMLQITNERTQDKEELEGLNIALDAKQQELESLKRRYGVRGSPGPASGQTSKPTPQRRGSLVNAPPRTMQATPRMSRPSSIASESGAEASRERKVSDGSKIPALSKSTRLNSSTSSSAAPAASKTPCGTMGPPPLRPRASNVGASKTLTRSSSTVYSASKTKASKPSGALSNAVPPATELGEKENCDGSASRRLSRIPTLSAL